MIAVGQRAVIAAGAFSTVAGRQVPMPEWVGLPVVVLDGPDADGDYEVRREDVDSDLFVHASCLRVPFEALPVAVANDAVRAVEDAIDAHTLYRGGGCLDGEQGPASVRALLDLGWTPPAVTS